MHRPADEPTGRAVLYVHGFADYFFQTEFAEWWTSRGLRLLRARPPQVRPLAAGAPDPQLRRRRAHLLRGHRRRVVAGGGARRARPRRAGRPLDRRAGRVAVGAPPPAGPGRAGAQLAVARHAGPVPAAHGRHRRRPRRRRFGARCGRSAATSTPSTARACTATTAASGTTTWPGSRSTPGRSTSAGWPPSAGRTPSCTAGSRWAARSWCCARARACGPRRCRSTCTATTSCSTSQQIRRWAPVIGRHVTVVSIPGARHDVVLSRPEVRSHAYAELDRWVTAYAESGGSPASPAPHRAARE